MNLFKLDNRGITLVELITSMAVASILFIGVMAFMNAGSTGYTTSTNQTTLQDDVQDILNYLYDITICSTDVYLYNDGSDVLCILAPDNSSNSADKKYFLHYLCFNDTNQSLYYKKNIKVDTDITSASVRESSSNIKKETNLLANNVTKFRTSIRRKADFEATSTSLSGDSYTGGIQSDGDDANSVSLVSYSITVNDGKKTRTADVAVRPRNMMDSKLSFYGLFGTPAPTAPSGVVSPTST